MYSSLMPNMMSFVEIPIYKGNTAQSSSVVSFISGSRPAAVLIIGARMRHCPKVAIASGRGHYSDILS